MSTRSGEHTCPNVHQPCVVPPSQTIDFPNSNTTDAKSNSVSNIRRRVTHVPSTGPGQSGARAEIPMSPPSLLNSEGIRSAVYLEKGLGSHTLFASGSVTNLK